MAQPPKFHLPVHPHRLLQLQQQMAAKHERRCILADRKETKRYSFVILFSIDIVSEEKYVGIVLIPSKPYLIEIERNVTKLDRPTLNENL